MGDLIFVNQFLAILFIIFYGYQLVYILMALFQKDEPHQEVKAHRFAVLIAARNEERVIGHLIESIHQQTYEGGEISIFVVADNCTDKTAQKARELGATVYERFNQEQVGKGYALDFLLQQIKKDYQAFDGYFVFDADNLLDPNYIKEMNQTFCDGYEIITSYRNSKNYGDNWISSGYAIWFLWESAFLNRGRMLMKKSCAISGTGFFFSQQILEKHGGWKCFLLTEDIQFTIENVLQGEQVGYCQNAIIYDEQPVVFKQSFRQRMRWVKGTLQVFSCYSIELIKSVFKFQASCYDMLMMLIPPTVLTFFTLFYNLTMLLLGEYKADQVQLLYSLFGKNIFNMYMVLFMLSTIVILTQWNRIHTTPLKKVLSIFTFPFFMFTYIPVTLAALFQKVEWKPIEHHQVKTIADIKMLETKK